MKRRFPALLMVLLLLPGLTVRAEALCDSASAAMLMDADTGEVLFARRADDPMRIASTTKVMTALLVIEHGGLRETVAVKPEHLPEGSSMYLKAGEQITVETLLYGLLLCSGNDAAMVLADYCCGSAAAFAAKMNARAAELGMQNTHFENPSGLDGEDHHSTARDMALLLCCAMENPTLRRIISTREVQTGGRSMSNHNKLLWQQEGCIGGKTGYTRAAGRTLVSYAVQNGRRLAAVTLCDGNDWQDHRDLFSYGFGRKSA